MRATRWDSRLGGILLLVVGLALHLPLLYRPFGVADFNAGMSFGVFAKNFAKHGFAALHGVPIGPQVLDDVALATPYLNHPPGGFWVFALVGAAEWQLRLVTVIAHVACAILLMLLLRRALGDLRAWLAGLAFLPLPIMLVDCQVSWELVLWGLGLLLLLADQRLHVAHTRFRSGWTAVLVVVSALGPWIDWQYGFVCLALLATAGTTDARATLRRLAVPWAVSLASLLLVLAWREWAGRESPWPAAAGAPGAATLVRETIGAWPAFDRVVAATLGQLHHGYTWPVLVLALLGLPALLRAAPRLGLALLMAGVANPLLFASYTVREMHYLGSLGPLVVASLAALPLGTWRRAALSIAFLGAVVLPSARARVERSDTTFFADLGRVVTGATREPEVAGGPRTYSVSTTFHACYGYYVETDWFWPFGIRDATVLEAYRARRPQDVGVRCLWLRFAFRDVPTPPKFALDAGLEEYLAAFPRRRVPELECRVRLLDDSGWLVVEEAWLVTIEP